jgi:transposase
MLRTGSSLGAALQEHHHGAQITLDEEPPHVSQALYRTQPEPAAHSRRRTMSHYYRRHGTTTLFAAHHVTTGKVIGQCMSRQRHQEWLRFRCRIDAETPRHLDVHLIADNYAIQKHAWDPASLTQDPRFHMRFTPTSASWLNLVERIFGIITEDRIRCSVFTSVPELVDAINEYLEDHNADPKPFLPRCSADQTPIRGR